MPIGLKKDGGEGGIRTHVPLARQDAFEAPPLRPLRYLSAEVCCPPELKLRPTAALSKERLQLCAAFRSENAAHHRKPVVEGGLFVHPHR